MALSIATEERHAVHHIGAPFSARLAELGAPGGPNHAIPRIFQWLGEHQIPPLGSPLYVYRHHGGPDGAVADTDAVAVATQVATSEGIDLGQLPAGSNVVGRHISERD